MHCPDNPTGKIQLPNVFALLFVILFTVLTNGILTVAASREQDGFPLYAATVLLGYVMGRCLYVMSTDDAPVRELGLPLSRVHRLPTSWATQVAPPGKMLTHCTTCWKPPPSLYADPDECCWCHVENFT